MQYLLDTCVISDFYQGDKNTVKKIIKSSPRAIAISSITVAELEYGVCRIRGTKKGDGIEQFNKELFGVITIIPLEYDIAKKVGEIRAELERKGKGIGSYDLLIAGTAVNKGLIMVTNNTKEFSNIEGLEVEDWRSK